MAVRDAFEFRYGANPGTSSGVVGMYLDNAGKLTVGTTTEIVTRLDVIGRIQIRDGTQGAGKVLTSDAYGIASWTPPLTGGPGASSNIVITEFGPYRSLSKTSLGIQTYCALSNIATSRENHGARVWKEGNEWFTASINEIDAIPGYGDSRIQSFRVTCFKGDIIQGTSSGVTKIIAGTNVTVSPSNGIGDVTINASGGSGSSTPATTCADLGGTWNSTACSFAGTSSSGASFSVCNNNGTVVSGSAPACVGAQANGGAGTSRYRAINCLAPYQSAKMNGTMFYTSGKWSTQMWTANIDCTNGTILVVDMQGGGGSTGTAGVTQINQGSGIILTPSPIITTGTVSADTTYLQRRIAQSCSTGQVMRGANQDGTPICIAVPASAICTYGGSTYSTGAECATTKYTNTSGAHWKEISCNANGTWSSESGEKNGFGPELCGQGAGGGSVAGAFSIGGGGWEGSTNNVSCITSCEPWGGATCSGSNATCNKFIQCPSGYNKVMTGDYQGKSDLPSHHNPFGFTSVDRGASFTCYK